ncbi:hypothetical protein GIW41_28605 [Pseudomonas sp. PA-6-1D]|uniref:hypothetical protein n=1 Tax=unclassified Pseudomonas TaxID=196821 RepID=UPI001F3F2F9F|nr:MULTISPECIES: hypothetical protein [unclassified Pseudomonas]MCF5145082.1 hypothetical protein [Pseudomonas sp. PA-6-3C]MCF5149082.1 hypothetical protein [Pseudomonas sp. PA-6-3F]MCF5162148.1 hypothetical protein [Pseudomonas sp. PA-6-2E]MCF5179209.1 hypothetical protein [Pseudomonas sp. PA-6-1D]MCF5194882.1 hypothetical protein [Pseudomonas sp. PA-6-1H]
MKKLEYYSALPDSMLEGDIRSELVALLRDFENQDLGRLEFSKSLLELSDRQWHTYTILDFELKCQVEEILKLIWDGQDLELVEIIIGVVARLGLEEVYNFVRTYPVEKLSLKVSSEIKVALAEIGNSVSDPYSGMK